MERKRIPIIILIAVLLSACGSHASPERITKSEAAAAINAALARAQHPQVEISVPDPFPVPVDRATDPIYATLRHAGLIRERLAFVRQCFLMMCSQVRAKAYLPNSASRHLSDGAFVIGTKRVARIVSMDPATGAVVFEPGVTLTSWVRGVASEEIRQTVARISGFRCKASVKGADAIVDCPALEWAGVPLVPGHTADVRMPDDLAVEDRVPANAISVPCAMTSGGADTRVSLPEGAPTNVTAFIAPANSNIGTCVVR